MVTSQKKYFLNAAQSCVEYGFILLKRTGTHRERYYNVRGAIKEFNRASNLLSALYLETKSYSVYKLLVSVKHAMYTTKETLANK